MESIAIGQKNQLNSVSLDYKIRETQIICFRVTLLLGGVEPTSPTSSGCRLVDVTTTFGVLSIFFIQTVHYLGAHVGVSP